jgi:aminoglycoside phosphotransferase (APT) family kinase protein
VTPLNDRASLHVVRRAATMRAPKLHAGELDVSPELARRLIAEQFPHWADLPVHAAASAGTECVLYRLGEDFVVRLPRMPGRSLGEVLEQGMLARLAPHLPVPVPELIATGHPTASYPARWGVLRWLDGQATAENRLTAPALLAAGLAAFLTALWSVDLGAAGLSSGPPAYRGGPLPEDHDFTLRTIDNLRDHIDAAAVRSVWDAAIRLPGWAGRDTWIHADMMPGNILATAQGALAGVIDFSASGIGDPSLDLIVAWMLLPAEVRPAFRSAVGADDATWLRGRARALSWALGHLDYYGGTDPVMTDNARYTIREVLADAGHPVELAERST